MIKNNIEFSFKNECKEQEILFDLSLWDCLKN